MRDLSLKDVAYIKYFDIDPVRSDTLRFGPIGSALVVYMLKGKDMHERNPEEDAPGVVKISGYSVYKVFYEPDYSSDNSPGNIDTRITLLWKPNILTDSKNRKIPVSFYNNDFTKKFRVVLEGINEEGKMIHIEKIVE